MNRGDLQRLSHGCDAVVRVMWGQLTAFAF